MTVEAAPRTAVADRFSALDGLRALAMLSVFFFHALLSNSHLILAQWTLLPGVVWRGNALIANLDIGVAIFFALSGFLIYRPFVAAHICERGRPQLGRYARRRALRIYPAYWFAFIALFASGAFADLTRGQIALNLGLIQTWFGYSANSGIGQAWTLVVEITFYAFVPVWSWLIRRTSRGRDPLRCELIGVLFLLVVGFATTCVNFNHDAPRWYATFLPHLAAFAPGMLLAIASVQANRDDRLRRQLARVARYPFIWWLAAAAVFWVMCAHAEANPFYSVDVRGLGWQDMLGPIIAALMLTPLVLAPAASYPLHRALSWRPIAWIGIISYGAYLWHTRLLDLDLVQQITQHSGPGRGYPAIITGTTLALILTTIVAAVSWYAIERPLMRMGERIEHHGR